MNINFTFYLFKHSFLLVRTDLALYSLVLPERQEYYILLFLLINTDLWMHTAIHLRYSNSCQDAFLCSRACDRLCSVFLLCFCCSEQGHWCHIIRDDLVCGVLEGAWTYHPKSPSNSFSWHFSGVCWTKFKPNALQGCCHLCEDSKAPCLVIHISSLRQLHLAGPRFHICILTLLSAFLDAQILTSTAQHDVGSKAWLDTDITEEEGGHHMPRTCHRPGALPRSLEPLHFPPHDEEGGSHRDTRTWGLRRKSCKAPSGH